MKTVKLTTFDSDPLILESILRQTPNHAGKWDNVCFYVNEKNKNCDYWVVFEHLPRPESAVCKKENVIFIAGEPSSIKKYNKKFLNQFSKVITCQRRITHPKPYYMAPGHTWFPKKSYDELSARTDIQKTKLISIVVSAKSFTRGHRQRLKFCLKLKKHFGDAIDLFGKGIKDFDDKWEVLAPYKYSIAIENSVETDWMTEKIGDCYTSLTFPFYYGCPNIERYYDPTSYQLIDINDFEKSCSIIQKILNDTDHYPKHLEALKEARDRFLNQHSLIPLIAHFVQSQATEKEGSKTELVNLKPETDFENNFFMLHKIKRVVKKLFS